MYSARYLSPLLGLVIALGGCGTDVGSEDQGLRDHVYLEMARDMAPGASDTLFLDLRKKICDRLDASPTRATYREALAEGLDAELDPELVGGLTATAVASGCPQHVELARSAGAPESVAKTPATPDQTPSRDEAYVLAVRQFNRDVDLPMANDQTDNALLQNGIGACAKIRDVGQIYRPEGYVQRETDADRIRRLRDEIAVTYLCPDLRDWFNVIHGTEPGHFVFDE